MGTQTKTLAEQVADGIMNLIQETPYKAGDKLPTEKELCESTGAGRNTVREALKILASRNVLEIRQGAGTFVSEKQGIPDDPLGFSMVNDHVKLTKDLLGTPLDGRALAARVAAGDTQAASCFLQFGVLLRDALSPQIEAFNPDMICLGGQIMRSAPLFLSPLEALCNEKNIKLSVTQDTSMRTMQGLTRANSRYNGDR